MKKTILKYTINFIVGVIICFIIFNMNNLFSKTTEKDIYKVLSDGTFITGVLYLGMGLLIVIADNSLFDGLGYAFKSIAERFFKKRFMTYHEYKTEKNKKQKKRDFSLIIIGAFFLFSAILFTLLFNK